MDSRQCQSKEYGGWLTRIHLEGCGIGDVGVKTPAEAVKTSPKLRNWISPELEHRRTDVPSLQKLRRPPRDLDQGDYG